MKKILFQKDRLWTLFGFEGLDAEEFKKRTTAVQLAVFTAVAGAAYCVIYIFLGFPSVVYVIYVYITVCLLNLLYLRISHQYAIFGTIQLALIFLFPLATQLTIGGFIDASAVVLAVFLAPAGALLYARRDVARYSFYLFAVVVAGAAVWEYYYGRPEPRLPRGVVLTFFASNLISICGIIYFLLESFLQKQEELRTELRQSLETLRTTQNQLIQSEKMASLGELTAGIAHEIQNPLNFVNNFSEVSVELLDELREEREKGRNRSAGAGLVNQHELAESPEAELLEDLSQNLTKISQHGRRASSIVKGMLEHSRTSTGQREPIDLNALADEYLRLSYHGLRAKDKSFNAELITRFDPTLGKVSVVSQDMGRVLLNLFNNAFYAVQQRQKTGLPNYRPTITIVTKCTNTSVEIRVGDNGMGMPDAVMQKIFQPFFTTKPAGQGTGLGLSLSYDIVTKGHGGTLTVMSRPDEGTEFIIRLPT